MVTGLKVSGSCPRCSLEVPGWPTYENGLTSCLHCGYVLSDAGYRKPDFSELFKKYSISADKIRAEVIRLETIRLETERKRKLNEQEY